MSDSMFDGWNDDGSDAEYCSRLFGDNWDGLAEEEYHAKDQELFYLLFTPRDQTLKVGKAKDFGNLILRLQERRRQCGKDTFILGFKVCDDANKEEHEWKGYLSDHAISRESFDLSFCDSDFLWLSNFCLRRKITENVEREKDPCAPWFLRPTKKRDLETMIKDYLDWEWDGSEDPEFPDLVELMEVA
jgi:hypothetical protein